MDAITLLIAVVALIIAILAYQRTGGTAELKRKIESTISTRRLEEAVKCIGSHDRFLKREDRRYTGSLRESHPENRKGRIDLNPITG